LKQHAEFGAHFIEVFLAQFGDVDAVDEDFAGVSQGWEKYYWTPWRAYLIK